MPADVPTPAPAPGQGAVTRRGFLNYGQLLVVFGAFALMGGALVAQQAREVGSRAGSSVRLLDAGEVTCGGRVADAGTLVLYNSGEDISQAACDDARAIFHEMGVGAQLADVAKGEAPADFSAYDKVVLAVADLTPLGACLSALMDWVQAAGQLMVFIPPECNGFFQAFSQRMGVRECAGDWYATPGIRLTGSLMLGGRGHDYAISDPYDSSLALALDDACVVHAVSADEREVPLVWEYACGAGRVVFCNLRITEKATRGLFAQAFGLLGGAFAWPVIDGCAFYLDDFPSPVPGGSGEYIERDYGTSVSSFYNEVWWPDLRRFAQRYGAVFTGLIIEDYNDTVEPPFAVTQDTSRFQYFAGELLRLGGELGIHGYNHMPLVTAGSLDSNEGYVPGTYEDAYGGYVYWPSQEAMGGALQELYDFVQATFPDNSPTVYVPPSNILSQPGRDALMASAFDVRVIASIYFDSSEHVQYVQDFGVADDGVVNTPRIISGGQIDDYMRLSALSELNLHFVSSHFMHPDDMLDPDRGAVEGWASAYANICAYADWLYGSVPHIRNLTGSELGAAVQRWSDVCVRTTDAPDAVELSLEGLHDEACLLLRSHDALTCGKAEGAGVERLDDGLYLVRATSARVRVPKEAS